jgi:hypothetical protein
VIQLSFLCWLFNRWIQEWLCRGTVVSFLIYKLIMLLSSHLKTYIYISFGTRWLKVENQDLDYDRIVTIFFNLCWWFWPKFFRFWKIKNFQLFQTMIEFSSMTSKLSLFYSLTNITKLSLTSMEEDDHIRNFHRYAIVWYVWRLWN